MKGLKLFAKFVLIVLGLFIAVDVVILVIAMNV